MNLLLDVGNTAVKWACFADNRPGVSGHFVHREGSFAGHAATAWSGLPHPSRVLVANVAGRNVEVALTAWCAAHWQLQPVYLSATAHACGVTNAYPDPATLGIDRWAALIAAHHGYPGSVCVVDCGTAVTLDMVTAAGEHRGGLILPGIEMLQQTLLRNTAQLRLSGKPPAATSLADNTSAGIYGGAVYIVAAAIERSLADMRVEQGEDIDIVVTGGDAGRVLPLLHAATHQDPDLVLRGIALLAGEN